MFFEADLKWVEYEINNETTAQYNNNETPNFIRIEKAYYYFEPNYLNFKMQLNYIYDDTNIIKNKILGVAFIEAKTERYFSYYKSNDMLRILLLKLLAVMKT
jgi:hypothetical protein